MNRPSLFQRIVSTILVFVFSLSSLTANAQSSLSAKPMSVSFLFDFAQKLVDRGEINEAQLVLKKILRSEPENSSVKRLLKNIETQGKEKSLNVFKSSKPSEIASDIIFIQKNISVIERRNRELEFSIRKTLQENVFMYQVLARQNRELLEMRKKFLGYDGQSAENLQVTPNTDEQLKSYEKQIMERDGAFLKRSQEIGRIMKDVGKSDDTSEYKNEVPGEIDSATDFLEWRNDLAEKRAFLVEKALSLYEKNKDLTRLYAELTAVSQSLKEANESYTQTVQEYDNKIQKLNNIWVQDKAKQQTEIDRLKAQIKNEKVKVFSSRLSAAEEAVSDVSAQTEPEQKKSVNAPPEASKNLATDQSKDVPQKSEASAINKDVKDNNKNLDISASQEAQAQIKRLQDELVRREKELNLRSRLFDAKIKEIKEGWAKDRMALQKVRSGQVPVSLDLDSQEAIKDTDVYKNLMQELDYIKNQLALREEKIQEFDQQMAANEFQLEELQTKIAARDARIAQMDALIVTKDQQIAALKKELVGKVVEIKEKDKIILGLQNKLSQAVQPEVKDMDKRLVQVKNTDGKAEDKPVEELKALVAELETHLGGDSKKEDSVSDLKNQLAGALEQLQQKDQQIQDLKAKLESSDQVEKFRNLSSEKKKVDSQVKEYEGTIEDLKNQLNQAVSQRKQAEKDWQDANKKLADMVAELKSAQERSATSAKRLDEYVQKIAGLNDQLSEQAEAFKRETDSLNQTIVQKDKEIAQLKVELAEKDNQVNQFYSSIEEATQKLKSGATIRQDQKPTASVLSQQKQSQKSSKTKEDSNWDPANNDVYALQQRVNTLNKELAYAQDQLEDRTKERIELNRKLNQKEMELKVSSKSSAATDAGQLMKLEKELQSLRQQSELTKKTIELQEQSLAKSHKEANVREKSLKGLQSQLNKMQKQVGDYKSTIKEKEEQISFQKKALEHEIKKNETLTRKLRNITQTIGSDVDIDSPQAQSTVELRNSIKTYEIRERDYKKQIDQIQEQLKSSYVMIEDGESRIKSLKERLNAREEKISQLEKQLNHLKKSDAGLSQENASEGGAN